ncbi:LysM peptidoglycan-binding domain-containing protein [Flavobacterium sp. AG291]|uniref:LysM peptidoglycan-binding domain-containing protein n=1 Tax=Flavobacterium sp. AG291 TaxID=2184000 RepID=UPI000E0AA665|nr:LysM peptidoglycan-binding domain-containing protein [Flavobacterium sp. AG291]RDI06965.1 LysM domain-containing protein [Flavobacterium sp. AG291]
MKKILLLLAAFMVFQNVAAQDDRDNQSAGEETQPELIDYDTYFIDHKTTMGERMIMISKKYMVDPDEIYKYNEVQSDKNGLVPGQILKIPLHESHKQDLDKFKAELIKKNGGNPIQVPAVPPIKKKEEEEEEDE